MRQCGRLRSWKLQDTVWSYKTRLHSSTTQSSPHSAVPLDCFPCSRASFLPLPHHQPTALGIGHSHPKVAIPRAAGQRQHPALVSVTGLQALGLSHSWEPPLCPPRYTPGVSVLRSPSLRGRNLERGPSLCKQQGCGTGGHSRCRDSRAWGVELSVPERVAQRLLPGNWQRGPPFLLPSSRDPKEETIPAPRP